MTEHSPLAHATDARADAPLPPTAPAPAAALRGWRLHLAWAGLALMVVWGVVANVRAIPVYAEAVGPGDAAFYSLHVDAAFDLDPVFAMEGGVAERAGLPRGRLVAVEGRALDEGDTFLDAAARVRDVPGDAVRLSVVTAQGDTATVAVPRADAPPPEFSEAGFSYGTYRSAMRWLGLVVILGFLLAALVLVVRRSRSGVALLGAAAFAATAFSNPFTTVAGFVEGTQPIFGPLSSILITVFLIVFPDGRVRPRWAWAAVAFVGVGMPLVTFGPPEWGAPPSPVFYLTLVLFVSWIGVMVGAQVARYRRHATDVGRQQTKWALLGIGLGMVSNLAAMLVTVLLQEVVGVNRWTTNLVGDAIELGVLLLPAGVVLALVRYRLWDAEAAWSKSAVVGGLVLALTAIIAGGTALVQAVFRADGPVALALAATAAAVFFSPLLRRLTAWAEHRFLRDLEDLRTGLPDLVNHLRETESVEGIAHAVTDRVTPAVHATHAALAVPAGDGWEVVGVEGIAASSATAWAESAGLFAPPDLVGTRRQSWRRVVWRVPEDRQFPVRVALRSERARGGLAVEGWLALGPRPDGSGYGPDDLAAVAEIAGPVGRALQVARVREERTDVIADVQRSLREIRALLAVPAHL